MSLVYGIVMLNGQPVSRDVLENMRKALEFWGPDDTGLWYENQVGIGNLLLYNTPEAIYEKMPFSDESGNLILSASARIDNRSELCRLFRISPQQAKNLPDSYFIIKAYERWGEKCPEYLLGDWSFVIWDRKKQQLFVARDHHGITALYYHKNDDFFVFSSSLKGILCLQSIEKKVNEYKVSQILVGWNEGGPETCYQNIYRLPPAHTLMLSKGIHKISRYWLIENTPELRLKEEQQYIDLFMDIYTQAVKCRLRSYRPVGATLSGGLDSGSVCALASKELKKEGKRLPAFTAVPLYDTAGLVPPNRIGDEGPLAQAVADKCGNIDITFCKAENISPIEGVEKFFAAHPEPVYGAYNAFWLIDILQNSKKTKIGVLLNGKMGNCTISWPSFGEINEYNSSYFSTIKFKYILKKVINKSIFFYSHYFIHGKYYWIKKSGINISAISNSDFANNIYKAKWNPYCKFFLSRKKRQLSLIKPGAYSNGESLFNSSAYYKIEYRDPTSDSKLIEFCISLPYKVYISKDKIKPKIFYKVFFKLLPKEVLENRRKGIQSGDLAHRIMPDLNKVDIDNLLVSKNDYTAYCRAYTYYLINKN